MTEYMGKIVKRYSPKAYEYRGNHSFKYFMQIEGLEEKFMVEVDPLDEESGRMKAAVGDTVRVTARNKADDKDLWRGVTLKQEFEIVEKGAPPKVWTLENARVNLRGRRKRKQKETKAGKRYEVVEMFLELENEEGHVYRTMVRFNDFNDDNDAKDVWKDDIIRVSNLTEPANGDWLHVKSGDISILSSPDKEDA
jgi:hypothetical protein